jgi:hypothetical protein
MLSGPVSVVTSRPWLGTGLAADVLQLMFGLVQSQVGESMCLVGGSVGLRVACRRVFSVGWLLWSLRGLG